MNIQSLVWLIVSGVYNNYDFRWMDMLDFICNGPVDLGRERKIQNENICLQQDSNPHHASPRQESQRLRPLGHEGLMAISGLCLSG